MKMNHSSEGYYNLEIKTEIKEVRFCLRLTFWRINIK